MKLNLSGVAFGALMVGLVAAGSAKADAIATADLTVSGAFASVDSSGNEITSGPNSTTNVLTAIAATLSGTDTAGSTANLDGTTLTGPASTRLSQQLPPTNLNSSVTNTVGGSAVSSSSTLTGSLLIPGGVTSTTNLSANVLNGNISTGNNATSTTTNDSFRFTFTGSTQVNLKLTLQGALDLEAQITNTNNFAASDADAHVQLNFALTDLSVPNGTTGKVQTFAPDELNTSISANQFDSPTAYDESDVIASLSGLSTIFTLNPGDAYTFLITQTVQVNATAVPEPGTLALFGAGLAGLGFLGMRRQRKTGSFAA